MRERPVFHPKFGLFLAELRKSRDWTIRAAADLARRRHLSLTRQVLFRLERGQIKDPEPQSLRAVAALYEQDFDALLQKFLSEKYGLTPDVTSGTDDESSKLHIPARGAHDVTAVSASEGLAEPQPPITDVDAAAELAELAGGINAIATRLLARALGPNSDRPAKFRAGRQDTAAPSGRKRKAHRRSA